MLRTASLLLAVACAAALPSITWASPGWVVELREDGQAADAGARKQRLAAALAERALPLAAGEALTGRWHRLDAPAGATPEQLREFEARLRADPRLAHVARDTREQRLNVTPNDARYGEQWWLQAVAAAGTPGTAANTGVPGFTTAWQRSTGNPRSGSGAIVAVLDSGITSHPELNARLVPGYDFVTDAIYAADGNGRDNDPADAGDAITAADRAANPAAFAQCPSVPVSSWHGTVIAGQVAATTQNVEGVAAVNWFGRFMPVRVAGKCGASVADIVDGMRWAAGLPVAGVPANPNPARVLVLGYGSIDSCDVNSADANVAATARLYTQAISEVRATGAMVIVAAGNQRQSVGRPAACTGAFAVTALGREGWKANYANLGSAVALAAPGGDGNVGATCDRELADSGIVSTGNLGSTTPGQAGYVAASGTSFAAPMVAATAALMLAVEPALTVGQLEDGLRRSARPFVNVPLLGNCSLADNRARCACTTATCGAGMLDADEALRFAAAPAAYGPPVRSAPTLRDSRIEACAVLLGRPIPEPEPPPPPPTPQPPATGGGGGGGATSPGWLIGLMLATAWLARTRHGRAEPAPRAINGADPARRTG